MDTHRGVEHVMTPDTEPRVRIAEPPDRRPSNAGLVTVVVGIAGLLLGYLLGAVGTGDPANPQDIAAAPNRTIGSLTDPGASTVAPPPATTTSSTTTTSTTRPPAGPEPVLYERIPPMGGRRLVAIGERQALFWRAGSREPTLIDMPVNSWARWHDGGRHLAYLKYESSEGAAVGNELWMAFDGRVPQPVWIGVASFAWHPTEIRLAWIGRHLPETTWHVFAGRATDYGVEDVVVHDTGMEADSTSWISLVAFGDNGWVIQREDSAGSTVLSIASDGTVAGERADTWAQAVSPTGAVLAGDQVDHRQIWLDSSLAEIAPPHPQEPDTYYYPQHWAPESGDMLVYVEDNTGSTAFSLVDQAGNARPAPLPAGSSSPATTPDGSLLVGVTGQSSRSTNVVIYEVATGEWWTLTLEGMWWQIDIGQ